MIDALQTDDIEALRRLAAQAWRRADRLAKENAVAVQEKQVAVQEKQVAEAKLSTLVAENEVLLGQISDLTVQLAKATNRDVQLALELQLSTLRQALSQNAETMYGAKSERRKKDKDKRPKKDKKDQKGHGPTPQPKLPIEACVYALGDEDCSCNKCGADLRVLGECFEDRQHKATLRCIRDIHPSRRAVRTPHRGPSRAPIRRFRPPRGSREARGPSQAHVCVEASSHRPHPRAALSRPLTAPRTPPTSGARGHLAPASAGR